METHNNIKRSTHFLRNSVSIKIVIIVMLVLILLIPTSMISSLMTERETRRNLVVKEINQKWGGPQTIVGPYFTVPFEVPYTDLNGKVKMQLKYFHILPEKLTLDGGVTPHLKRRSNYEAVLYNTQFKIEGDFKLPSSLQLNVKPENILWDKAYLNIGITDMRGIQDKIIVTFNEKEYNVSPGVKTHDIALSGVSSLIALSPDKVVNNFSLKINVNGSEKLQFIPIAEESNFKLSSSWPSPSFNGAFLPIPGDISDKGFVATWKILQLNRNYPQYWIGDKYKIDDSAFGMDLLITADIYQKSDRISKYAIMFIVFTFTAFFISEIINKNRIHPIQYLLVGLGICLFYILLLSISEHISFNLAYCVSAAAIILLITGYTRGIIQNKYFTMTIFSVLTGLYSYLYIVIQQEDFALIMGSAGLSVVLGVFMFITRKIDWYALEGKKIEGL